VTAEHTDEHPRIHAYQNREVLLDVLPDYPPAAL